MLPSRMNWTYRCLFGSCIILSLILFSKYFHLPFRSQLWTNQMTDAPPEVTADENIQFNDPELLSYLRSSVLEPPSIAPYNLNDNDLNIAYFDSEAFYKRYAFFIFTETEPGFFVEAGALNGEDMSNTLWLEAKRGWNGLLIEPDLLPFQEMRRKNRKAWTANACLSVERYPKEETLFYAQNIQITNENSSSKIGRGMSYVKGEADSSLLPPVLQKFQENDKNVQSYNMTCFPLESFLLALGITKVDLLSLDVEHCEEKIIKKINFNKIEIQVIFIEWLKIEKSQWLKTFMEDHGYFLVNNTFSDYIFVKKGSIYEEIVIRKKLVEPH